VDENKYSIRQLAELTGFPARTIRYYVQEGLLEAPAGRGRGGFYYDSHLARLRQIKTLQQSGLRLEAIARLLEHPEISPPAPPLSLPESPRTWEKYEVAPGVEISVRSDVVLRHPGRLSGLLKLAKLVFKEDSDGNT
jgi:DNA-binding transcriptional MerR regulator